MKTLGGWNRGFSSKIARNSVLSVQLRFLTQNSNKVDRGIQIYRLLNKEPESIVFDEGNIPCFCKVQEDNSQLRGGKDNSQIGR